MLVDDTYFPTPESTAPTRLCLCSKLIFKRDKICNAAPFLNTFFPLIYHKSKWYSLKAACNIQGHLRKQLRDIIPYFSDMIPHASLDYTFGKRENLRHDVSFSWFSDLLFLPMLFHADTPSFLCGSLGIFIRPQRTSRTCGEATAGSSKRRGRETFCRVTKYRYKDV